MNAPGRRFDDENENGGTIRLTLFLALFLVCLIRILFLLWTKHQRWRSRHQGTSLLLCGIENAGKTHLFNRLTSNVNKQTSTCMSVHHGTMILDYLSIDRPVKHVHVIDLPSKSRLYQRDFHTYRTTVKGIIFIIDSTTIEQDLADVGNYLYDILHEKYFRKQHLNLLIFCNKQDLDKHHHSLQSIRQLLEEELTYKRQKSRSWTNFHGKTSDEIGRLGKETFEFDDVKDIRIEFVEGSVLNIGSICLSKQQEKDSTSQLFRVHQWIARVWFQ